MATGMRVPRKTQAPLTFPGMLSTAGHCDQSSVGMKQLLHIIVHPFAPCQKDEKQDKHFTYNVDVGALVISDADILRRLDSSEDSFVEKKVFSDSKDVVKTCVAFANSCPVGGPPGILFYGVKDDGTIENSQDNLDPHQKTIRDKLSRVYPSFDYQTRILKKDGKSFLAILVPGSATGPHFSGPAYVREGSSTVKASEDLFSRLIDRRERKVREILRWKNARILMRRYVISPNPIQQRNPWAYSDAKVIDCTAEWLQVEIGGDCIPFALDTVNFLGYAPSPPNWLQIEVPQ